MTGNIDAEKQLDKAAELLLQQKGVDVKKITTDQRQVRIQLHYGGVPQARDEMPETLSAFIAERYEGRRMFLMEVWSWFPPSGIHLSFAGPEGASKLEQEKQGVIIPEREIVLSHEILIAGSPMRWMMQSYQLSDWLRTTYPSAYENLEGEVNPEVISAIASLLPEPSPERRIRTVTLAGQPTQEHVPQPLRWVEIH